MQGLLLVSLLLVGAELLFMFHEDALSFSLDVSTLFVEAVFFLTLFALVRGRKSPAKDKHKKAFFFERQNFLRKPNK